MTKATDWLLLTTLQAGFNRSRIRFNNAYQKNDRDRMYIALFETLNWCVAIQDKLSDVYHKRWHLRYPYGSFVDGIRFARNRVHHQWMYAVYFTKQHEHDGKKTAEWIWKPMEELPTFRNKYGMKQYNEHLALKPARGTILRMSGVLGMAIDDVSYGIDFDLIQSPDGKYYAKLKE